MKIWVEDLLDYFKRLVLDAMDYRKKNNIHRPDMINMLMEAKEANSWSDVEIVAQCFVFFLAGFETSATFLSFACHELMENSGIQKRLFEEISENYSNDELTYEDINKMTYLDAVMSETLRKWPNAAATDRQCNKTLKFENPDGLGDVVIKEGELIWIPIAGLHRDPKYFEEPKLFNPDRFSEENKRNIQPFTYIPFGVGPRACIGNRFALMMAKTILCYIIKNFELKPSPKSTIPLDLTGGGFRMKPKKGFWLNLRNRSSN
uniref:Cytochrome P450 n=1 Tax=Megaselia scalaris TaxID=36166 RepID=T1GSI1_MEGSC